MMDVSIDPKEIEEALRDALTSDADLLAEVDELFFGENSRYETRGVLAYVFTVGQTPANGANGECLAVRRRDKGERRAVGLAPDEYGLVHRVKPTSCGMLCQV